MIEQATLQHHIQKHIVGVLAYKDTARFSELRPPGVDTNLFSYHLKSLIRDGFITKLDKEYTLSGEGLGYVDRVSSATFTLRRQPKIITMLLIQNSDGQVLLQKRKKQPHINTWTLPYGKIHIDDLSVQAAARRESLEKLGIKDPDVRHVGDCYIRVYANQAILSTTSAHIFRYEVDMVFGDEALVWVEPIKLHTYDLAPAVEQIIARSFFGDEYFFAEFEHEWSPATL
jgi:8-oxo-dGTP pyrophosphatase MutT (NUDIX family)